MIFLVAREQTNTLEPQFSALRHTASITTPKPFFLKDKSLIKMGSRRDNCKYNSLRWSTALAVAQTNTDLQLGQLKCPKNKTSRSFTVWFRRKSCVMRWRETEEVGFRKCRSIFSSYEFSSMNDLHALVNVVTNRPVRFPMMKYFTKHENVKPDFKSAKFLTVQIRK